MSERKAIYWNILFICLYMLAGKIGLIFASLNPSVSVIWPPTGIAIATILLFGYRFLPGIFIGAFLTNFTTTGFFSTSLIIGLGNTLEALLVAYVVNAYAGGRYVFDRVRYTIIFVIFTALASALTAVIALSTLTVGGLAHFSYVLCLTLWLGNMGGAFILAPLIIVWVSSTRHIIDRHQIPELISVTIFLALTELIIFNSPGAFLLPDNYAVAFIIVLPLLWLALRFKRRIVTLVVFIISILTINSTVHGLGPFVAMLSPNDSLIVLQIFLVTTIITLLLVISLVAERAQTYKALAVRERHFHALIEKSSSGIVLLDKKGDIAYSSSSVERLTGYTPAELLGTSGRKFFYLTDVNSIEASPVQQQAEVFLPMTEVSFRRKDGTLIWIESTSTNLLSDVDINAIVVNFHDITERKQLQEKKNQFLSLISHQLHTPLETIRKYADSLLNNKKQFSVLEQTYLHEIDRSSIEMTKHVENLIKIFRIEAGILDIHPRTTKLRNEVDEALQRVNSKLTSKRIKIDKRFTLQGVVLSLDPFIFTSLLSTLMSEIISHIPHGGVLSIEIMEYKGHPAIKITPSVILNGATIIEAINIPVNGPDFLVAKALAAYMGMNIVHEIFDSKESLTIILPLS